MSENIPFLHSHFALKSHNTFGFEAYAEHAAIVSEAVQIQSLIRQAIKYDWNVTVLGGGSNVVLQSDLPGLTVLMQILGKQCVAQTDTHWIIEAGAGEVWHDFVAWTLAQGWGGLENFALIPGTVGASPVQNIGAYGVEIADRLHSVTAFDRRTDTFVTLEASDCQFAYRDSLFKQAGKDRYIITAVRFSLPKVWAAKTDYAELAKVLSENKSTTITPQDIFEAIVAIRTRKLPDPKVIGNAGSFFKNPLISAGQRESLLAQYPQLVSYPQANGEFKVAAGWLIEQAGWKGKKFPPLFHVGVYEKQALVLVHYGEGTGDELMKLALNIQADVMQKFGVKIEPEPILLPA